MASMEWMSNATQLSPQSVTSRSHWLLRSRCSTVEEAGGSGHKVGAAGRNHVGQLPQRPLGDPLGDLDVHRVGGHLVIDEEAELLLRRQPAGRLDRQHARHVDRDGLGQVDVAPGFHGRPGLLRVEVRQVLDGDGLHAAGDQLLVAGQAGEPPGLLHAEGLAELVHRILEVVAGRVELIAPVLLEVLAHPLAPAAAADDAQLDLPLDRLGRGRRLIGGEGRRRARQGRRGGGRGHVLQKMPPGAEPLAAMAQNISRSSHT